MELKHYLNVFWRWLWLIILLAIAAGGTTLIVGALTLPVYAATATVLVNQAPHGDLTDQGALITGQQLARTYVQLLTKRPILEETIATAGVSMGPDELARSVHVALVGDTGLITIQVENTDPGLAARLANLIPTVFARQNETLQMSRFSDMLANLSQELETVKQRLEETQFAIKALGTASTVREQSELTRLLDTLSKLEERHTTLLQSYESTRLVQAQATSNIQIVETALVPAEPIRPRILQNTLLATLAGAIVAVIPIFLIEYLDDRVRSMEQIVKVLGVPVLGMVGRLNNSDSVQTKQQKGKTLVVTATPRSPMVEAFRTLRTNTRSLSREHPIRSLLVTSVVPAEGKSTISANLAVVMAQAKLQVLLLDADFRRPSIHRLMECSNEHGLMDLVLDPSAEVTSLIKASPIHNLYVLPTGSLSIDPIEFLDSDQFHKILENLITRFDLVIIDSPPLLPVADAAILAQITDGVLMVVDVGETKASMLRQGKEQLDRVSARLLGVVMNRVPNGHTGYPYYYGNYYETEQFEGKQKSKTSRSRPAKNSDAKPEETAVELDEPRSGS